MELGVGENRSRTGEKSGGLGFSLLLDNGHFSLNQPSLFHSLSPCDVYTLWAGLWAA